MNKVQKRIQKEIEGLQQFGRLESNITDGTITTVRTFFVGAPDSPFEDGKYFVEITLGTGYPMSPPEVKLKTPIYHPNFDGESICVDILQGEWTPALTLVSVMKSLELLLDQPNPDSPLNSSAADAYSNDPDEYRNKNQQLIKERKEKEANENEENNE